MQRSFFSHVLGGAALASLLWAASALAADASYDGTTPSALQTLTDNYGVSWANNVLAPAGSGGTPAAPSKSPFVSEDEAPTPASSVTTLNGGTVDWVFGAVNYRDAATVSDSHQVIITGGTVSNGVYGADHWFKNGNTEAANNCVAVSGGKVGSVVIGGQAQSDASGDASATAKDNFVTVSGGAVTRIEGGDAWNDSSGNASASNNTVEIRGGTVTDTVYGGYAFSDAGNAAALNNLVRISATPSALNLATVWLYGGYAGSKTGATQSSGNTLQIDTTAGVKVLGLSNFQNLNFALPASLAPNVPMLTVADTADLGTEAQINISAPGLAVQSGDTFTLIDAAGATLTGSVAVADDSTLNGYAYTLAITDDNKLTLTVGEQVSTSADITAVPVVNPAPPTPAGLAGSACQRKEVPRWTSSI
ncbi:MAG: hypothetical protein LBQ32_09145 [Burkholderiaceae bacterium]|jgi:hypothetical protein|nr:hypothetical protein [Burkholderiaceae bacterium]